MPMTFEGIEAASVHQAIKLLTNNLVNITDTTGEFLLTLPEAESLIRKAGMIGNGHTALVYTDCTCTTP